MMKKFITLVVGCLLIYSIYSLQAEIPGGGDAPDFTLTSVDGKSVKLSDYKGKVVVLEWFNLGCPFVRKHYDQQDMQALQKEYTGKGVIWLCINSTNPNHKDFLTAEKAAAQVKEKEIHCTAMLQDADGKVGKLYGAKTTPHMFIIHSDGKLMYQGAIDDKRALMESPKQAKNHVRGVLDKIMAGTEVSPSQTKPYGCSVKYAN